MVFKEDPCPARLSEPEERRRIAQLPRHKVRVPSIAEALGRHRSRIYREIRRNSWHDQEVPAANGYWLVTAQKLAVDRRARQRKLARNPDLCALVIERLRQGWSPEQIAGRPEAEPGARHQLCHETIYAWIYSPSARARNWPATCRNADGGGDHDAPVSREVSCFPTLPGSGFGRKPRIAARNSAIGNAI